jgi:hypothetical protein
MMDGTWRLLFGLLLGACTSSAELPPSAPSDPSTCYSPSQNLDAAYEPGAVGCACNSGQPYVCVEDTTGWRIPLTCISGRWQARTKVRADACQG